jgi:hypothetical protein
VVGMLADVDRSRARCLVVGPHAIAGVAEGQGAESRAWSFEKKLVTQRHNPV